MLERQENKNIEEFLNNLPENYFVLEDEIDLNIQMKYMKFSDKIKDNLPSEEDILAEKENLFDPEISIPYKKKILAQLASINKVEAYRIIEDYKTNPIKQLKNWSILAFHESKMLIYNSLSDTRQVFIASGLGGKNNKLRFFVVLFTQNKEHFSEFQKKIVKNEFGTVLEKNDSVLEKIKYEEDILVFTCLVPIKKDIQQIMKSAIEESNQYGNFLQPNLLITNVKKMTFNEIRKFIVESEKSNEENQNNKIEL